LASSAGCGNASSDPAYIGIFFLCGL